MVYEILCVFQCPESWKFSLASPEILNHVVSVLEAYHFLVLDSVANSFAMRNADTALSVSHPFQVFIKRVYRAMNFIYIRLDNNIN